MADNKDLTTRIKIAENILNNSFGITEDQEGQGANRFLDLESLAASYKEEASRKEITQQFLSISKAIRNMRSSYLPIDFFLNGAGQFSEDLVNKVSPQESYENAFMRMLGMPIVSTSEFGISTEDVEIRSGQSLKTIDPVSGNVLELTYNDVKAKILDERQRPKESRKILIDNSIYNLSDKTSFSENTISIRSLSVNEIASLLGTIVDSQTNQLVDPQNPSEVLNFIPNEISRASEQEPFINPLTGQPLSTTAINELSSKLSGSITTANIQKIEEDLWKFSYLLIPPIQSAEISHCVNEPDKIIAPPFFNIKNKKINNEQIRPTLLESVIRIRLDKVSGTTTFLQNPNSSVDSFSIDVNLGSDTKTDIQEDDYGILEALFILRLRAAISGLAQKLYSDIDIIINEMKKNNRMPQGNDANNPLEAAIQVQKINNDTNQNTLSDLTLTTLEQQKLIEDSIMFLLGDNSEVIDLQSKTQRSSSIYNSHMMSGLIDIIDVPRKRINEEKSKIIENRNNQTSLVVEQKVQEIGSVLGTDIGIGTIDLAVFALAFFTISETSLLGLLNSTQYERLKNGEFKDLIPGTGDKEDTIVALNEFSQLVIDGYNLFINDLKNDLRID